MRLAGRRGPLFTALIVSGVLGAGCTEPNAGVAFEPPPEVRPAPSGSYLVAGKRLLAVNEPAMAMKAFNASMSTDGVTAEAHTGAGIAAQRQGLLNLARRHFERSVDLAPNSATAHNNLGVVLLQLKEYHAARAAFRAALKLSEDRSGERSGGDSEMARRNLVRVEAVLARLGEDEAGAPAETHRVVRLGTSEFRLIPAPKTGNETPAEAPAGTEAD